MERERRGRSPSQPSQKKEIHSYEIINNKPNEANLAYFNDAKKQQLRDVFTLNSSHPVGFTTEIEKVDPKSEGVRIFEAMQKNLSSATNYNLISNLTTEQLSKHLGYDGKTPDASMQKPTSHYGAELESERVKRKTKLKAENKQERPLPLRPEIVDKYINFTLNSQGGQSGLAASIIAEIYKLNIDNRIFNNLKQQLNELIDDERSLISVPEFKSIFFTYFKDVQKSATIYEKLLSYIKCYLIDD